MCPNPDCASYNGGVVDAGGINIATQTGENNLYKCNM